MTKPLTNTPASWMVVSGLAAFTIAATAQVTELGPETTAGWTKYEANPVLGGKLGTCFDIAVLREEGRYRMWFSWRPKKSLALVESTDGIHWGDPQIEAFLNRKSTRLNSSHRL